MSTRKLMTITWLCCGLAGVAHASGPSAGYKRGFFIQDETGDNRLRINGHLQVRFTYDGREESPDRYALRIPRGRLKFNGNVFTKDLKFTIHVAYDNGTAVLKDYFIDYTAVPGWLRIRFGQHKRMYSRQYILSGEKLQFVDRGISHRFSYAGRDLGLSLHNGLPNNGLEWALGVYNGIFADSPTLLSGGSFINRPTQFDPIVVARLAYNLGGIQSYSMGDLEGGPFRFALGLNAQMAFDADDSDDGFLHAGVDLIAKVHGFAFDAAFYANWAQTGEKVTQQDLEGLGGYVAVSYSPHRMFLPGLRWHVVDPEGDNNTRHELEAVFNVLVFSHRLKIQVDGAVLLTESGDKTVTDWRTRTQLNFVF